eukprot:scaffold23233_cov30-Tisochrysis_lutea.AAC.6
MQCPRAPYPQHLVRCPCQADRLELGEICEVPQVDDAVEKVANDEEGVTQARGAVAEHARDAALLDADVGLIEAEGDQAQRGHVVADVEPVSLSHTGSAVEHKVRDDECHGTLLRHHLT